MFSLRRIQADSAERAIVGAKGIAGARHNGARERAGENDIVFAKVLVVSGDPGCEPCNTRREVT